MNGRLVCAIGLSFWCVTATSAWAQDKGDVGLTVSTPQAIGVTWHASERLAIRPDVSFAFTETDGEDSSPDVSSKSVTFGVAALFYTHRWDDLRVYVSPRFTYSHASSDLSGSSNVFDSSSSAWGLSGSIGGQYALGSRFGVFAEAGLIYSSQRAETSIAGVADRTAWTFGSRAALGGILYF